MEAFVYLTVIFMILLAIVFIRHRFLSFRGQTSSDYAGLGPDFDLTEHLGGACICEGAIFGPTGRLTSRFSATMNGHWEGGEGVVEFDFLFDGGATQHRTWHISVDEAGHVKAEAEDTEGVGKGQLCGPTLQLLYTIVLPEDAGGHKLNVTDWMYLTETGTIINRSQFRKGSLLAAELVATIRKEDGQACGSGTERDTGSSAHRRGSAAPSPIS